MSRKQRACYVCGQNLYRKQAWATWAPPGRETPTRWICMACGAHKGFGHEGNVVERARPRDLVAVVEGE